MTLAMVKVLPEPVTPRSVWRPRCLERPSESAAMAFAIAALSDGLSRHLGRQTLLGVTGSGKTFTMANVIAAYGKPALVIAHNKTLAAQLAQEYREFFPEN